MTEDKVDAEQEGLVEADITATDFITEELSDEALDREQEGGRYCQFSAANRCGCA